MAKSRRKSNFRYGFGSSGVMAKDYFPYFMFFYSALIVFGIIFIIYKLRASRKSNDNSEKNQNPNEEGLGLKKQQIFKQTLKKREAAREQMFTTSSEEDEKKEVIRRPFRRKKKLSG